MGELHVNYLNKSTNILRKERVHPPLFNSITNILMCNLLGILKSCLGQVWQAKHLLPFRFTPSDDGFLLSPSRLQKARLLILPVDCSPPSQSFPFVPGAQPRVHSAPSQLLRFMGGAPSQLLRFMGNFCHPAGCTAEPDRWRRQQTSGRESSQSKDDGERLGSAIPHRMAWKGLSDQATLEQRTGQSDAAGHEDTRRKFQGET